MFTEVPGPAAVSSKTLVVGPDGLAPERPAGGRRARAARRLVPYLYVLPAVILLLVWTYWPLVQTAGLSFQDWNLIPTKPKVFVGVAKYAKVLSLPELHQALTNTVLYIVAFLGISVALPLAFALLSRKVQGKARTFYQALIFVPFLVTPVATSAVWRWLFAPEGGTIPAIAATLGMPLGNVFRDPDSSMMSVIVIVGWQMLGFGVLVVSAGLAGISPDYAAAASIDGANQRQITWRIVLPLLSPSLVFLALMTILLSAQWTYPIIDLVTQGGPGNSSTNIYYLLYQFGFRNFDAGLSSAAGMLFFVGFGLVALVFVELSEKLSFHDN
ncbi:sugar ABC transporter permease [Sinomonas sp. ASV322]|uniref:carbohydrate ABC transporter permease n=1 Tax=Sinomonas sp. ASV322 TaxID=3041920 RepID=UPI0027DAE23D|nr:sugar ABC transporter permease [Sinomonas sp. ASV322]MDQ4501475.1 sugar ABC transporter permease [Sinomonas sp. ASV322]